MGPWRRNQCHEIVPPIPATASLRLAARGMGGIGRTVIFEAGGAPVKYFFLIDPSGPSVTKLYAAISMHH